MSHRSSDTSTLAQLPTLHLDAAGLDIGSTEIWAAVPVDRDVESVR